MAKIKKISELEQMQSLSDSSNVIIEEGGVAKRFPASLLIEEDTVSKSAAGSFVTIEEKKMEKQELQITLSSDTLTDFSAVTVTQCGKNLIPFPYTCGGAGWTSTINGITWTVNEDGSVTANGTATADSSITLCTGLPIKGYAFSISGGAAGGKVDGTSKYALLSYDQKVSWSDYGDGVTGKIANDVVNIVIKVYAETTVSNILFKPQVELGDKITSFEIGRERTTVSADASGVVKGIEGLTPSMTLFTNNSAAVINCTYKVPEDNGVEEKISQALKMWSHLKWVCVGDSHTEKNLRATKNYHDYVSEKTGIQVVNFGASGTGYKATEAEGKAFYQRVANIPDDTDVITIYGSGNDLSQTLGTPADTGTDTICGCVNTTIDNIYARLPLVQIGIVSPCPWGNYPPSNPDNLMAKYSEALRQICANRSIPFLDLYHESGLRPWEEAFLPIAYSRDEGRSCHPDENGHKILSGRFYAFLNSLIGTYGNEKG